MYANELGEAAGFFGVLFALHSGFRVTVLFRDLGFEFSGPANQLCVLILSRMAGYFHA